MSLQALARTGSALLLGLLVTLALLLLMQTLILRDSGDAIAPPKLRFLDYLPPATETATRAEPAPAAPDEPPPPPLPNAQVPPEALPEIPLQPITDLPLQLPDIRASRPLRMDFDVAPTETQPAPEPAPAASVPAGEAAAGDGDLQPLLRVEPLYPRAARRRGIEGSVLVEFTVTSNGRTRDVRVIESEPPGVFDQAAVSAAQQFRFRPRVADGKPVDAPGVRNRITFRLE